MTTTTEPGICFWLNFVEGEGALWDERDVVADVVLTANLQRTLDLPEEVRITADPEAAREEHALLLIPGHPLLHSCATQVLERGDVGVCHMAWPASANPPVSVLAQRARAHLPVQHGKVDAAERQELEVYLPVLRVGALVTYSVSVEETFQEVEEVWVDAATGLEPPEVLRARLARAQHLAGAGAPSSRRLVEPDLDLAVAAANELIEKRARQRREALSIRYRNARTEELARAAAYYEAALQSIEQRARSASEERRHLYRDQAEATEIERERRLQEIEEKHQPSHEIRPFRMHLVYLPALHVPVVVRRGARAYSFSLTYVLASSCFLPVRCPRCGAPELLVAGKDALGCRFCMPGREELTVPVVAKEPKRQAKPAGATPPAPPEPPTPGPGPATPPAPPKARAPLLMPAAHPAPPKARASVSTSRAGLRPTKAATADPGKILRAGAKLTESLWIRVATGERWKPKETAPNSPMSALSRLYGLFGPSIAAGLPPGARLRDFSTKTAAGAGGLPNATTGHVITDSGSYPYTLRWRIDAGVPSLGEVLPYYEAVGEALRSGTALQVDVARRLHHDVPAPRVELDAIGQRLWETTLPGYGLPVVVRCLCCWWRFEKDDELQQDPSVVAASLTAVIARRAGVQVTNRDVSLMHDCDPEETARLARVLSSLLGRQAVRWF